MGRKAGALNKRTLGQLDIIAAMPEKDQTSRGVADALGVAYMTAWRLLKVARATGRIGAQRQLSAHQLGHRTNVIHQRDTLPSNSLTDEQARIAQGLGLTPGRAAWLLSCPRDGSVASRKAIGWRGGNAIG